MTEREFDVVVLGATSVAGREVCRYLARREPAVRWAAAGRSPDRIAEALGGLGVTAPATLTADTGDPAALAALAGRARVVLNLVGPYIRSADGVIAACIEAGAHYVDLTGETPFVRRVQDRFDAAARAAEVKVVQMCGFEALPADMAVRLAAVSAHERFGEALAGADLELIFTRVPKLPRVSDIASGGTIQSIVEVIGDPDSARIADPSLFVTEPSRAAAVRASSPIRTRPRLGITGAAISPLIPAATINPPAVHRSAELAGEPVLRYREGYRLPGGRVLAPATLVLAAGIGAATAALFRLARLGPARRARLAARLSRTLPQAGFGPATERLDQFAWTFALQAHTTGGHTIRLDVEGDGHPGYLTTSTMMGEAGALLAEAGATPDLAGCLTPAIALGTACAPRFAQAGLRFRLL